MLRITMLDPLTAVASAGNVVQFVQFGCNLVARAYEVYTSGTSTENLEMDTVVSRLLETVEELDNDRSRTDLDSSPKTSTERRLVEIAEASAMNARDILSRLEGMKIHQPRSVRSNVSKAFGCAWMKDELNSLTKRVSLIP